ncbi:ABC transporter permease subunit [Arhodomonas aquaeolei]|uniref:ABC transporter permease subunit n=1 Tax=Arhodomonas aquaeolei TaxID=2369 RepID=UPI00035C7685|nr:branched-chain amino acid ABC transporter permease [Arhodomonas aquaeolei]
MFKRLQIEDYLVALLWIGVAVYGSVINDYAASSTAYYILNVPMALGLAMLWGISGVLSFGQVAFFGLAGYTYGIVAGNLLSSPGLAAVAGIAGGLAAALVLAVAFGYFIFYGRVEAWIVPIVTLVMTLILATFMGQTAGYEWKVGEVLLGGYNGMTNIPPMNVFGSDLFGRALFYYVLIAVVIAWLAVVLCVRSRFGDVLIALREDPLRTELFGHDVRLMQLLCFSVAALLAGLSGVLYVQWGNYITPDSMGLLQATLPVVWVAVGARTSLLGVTVATVALNVLSFRLSSSGNQYAFVILGALLVVAMVVPTMGWAQRLSGLVGRRG